MKRTACAKNPNPKSDAHSFHVREIDFISHILCDYCDYPMVQLFCNGFSQHISPENMTRLATSLIEKQPLSPAELRLAEHVKEVIFS